MDRGAKIPPRFVCWCGAPARWVNLKAKLELCSVHAADEAPWVPLYDVSAISKPVGPRNGRVEL